MKPVTFTDEQILENKKNTAVAKIADARVRIEIHIRKLEQAIANARALGCAEGRILAASTSNVFTINPDQSR